MDADGLNLTGTSKSVEDTRLLMGTDEIENGLKVDVDSLLCKLCSQYEIRPTMAKHLRQLSMFKIVCVCDDSGSMSTPVDGTNRTRWDELCEILKIIVKISMIFDPSGVDIHFLNRDAALGVRDLRTLEQIFQISPDGYTPLVPVLKEIFESSYARRGNKKKLLVFIVTDGEPTDETKKTNVPQLESLMRENRQAETTHVSFVLCSDDPIFVNYFTKWDKTMKNVDFNDDYRTERDNVRRCHKQENYPFTFGDYIVKALVGAFVPEIDLLNEED